MSHNVTIAAGKTNVQLPDGGHYDAGKTVTLTDEEFAQIPSHLFPGTVIDAGAVASAGDAVVTQGTHVTLTSANAAGANPTQAEFNALRADVVALAAALEGTGRALA